MAEQTVVAVYNNMAGVESALRTLDKAGFPIKQVSVVGKDMVSEKEIHGYVTAGDVARSSAGTGAWVGGLFGLLAGAAFIWVPAFGPLIVAGPLAAALLGILEGAALGAAGGGILGVLVGWGVSREHVLKYEDHLKADHYLMMVHGDEQSVREAQTLLRDTNTADIHTHTAEPVAA